LAGLGFGVFSIVCGVATTLIMLSCARVLQGLAGGFLIPMSQILLHTVVPKRRLNIAIAVWGVTALSAPIFGPVLGGLLVDTLGWRWCFFVNLPIAALCVLVPWRLLTAYETAITKNAIDYMGLLLLVVWVAPLQILLDAGEAHGWFGSSYIIALAVVAVLGFLAFVIWELTEKLPIVDLRVLRNRGFTIAAGVMFLAFGATAAFTVIFVLWLQTGMAYTASWAGYGFAIMGVTAAGSAPLASILMSRMDPRILVSLGLTFMGCALFMRGFSSSSLAFRNIIAPQLLMGLGGTFFYLPLTGMAMAAVPPAEMASAAGLFNFARTLSVAIAAALGIAGWNRATAASHADLAALLKAPGALSGAAPAYGLHPDQVLGLLDRMVQTESLVLAINHSFFLLGFTFAGAAICIWLAPRSVRPIEISSVH
jgi:DHA2 family multidrug resistance protein